MLLSQVNPAGAAYRNAAGILKPNTCQLGFSSNGTQSRWDQKLSNAAETRRRSIARGRPEVDAS
jgi:hypothetical protein